MTNIVIYARYSSQAQTEQSIEGQLRVCHEFAEKNGYNIIHEYIDRALTGTNDNRPEFQNMICDSNKKEFEFVLVYKLDRFSRSKYDNAIYKHKLQLNGVKVISATESISNTPEGALMEGLLEMFAEMYSKDLSQKVKRGMRESILKGNYLGGNLLYGYKTVDKKIYIDEEKAPAIRYLFKEYAEGKTIKQIINELNNKGFRTNRGKPFSRTSLQTALSNIKYIGKFDNGEIQNDNYYPAIIDNDLFKKVQQKLNANKSTPGKFKAKTDYLLTGKAFCGSCGASLVGICGTSKTGTQHHYYTCSKKWKDHNCNKKNEKQLELELSVVRKIKNMLTPENIEKIATEVYEQYNKKNIDLQLKELNDQLIKIERELDKCFETFYNAENKDIQKRMNEKADSLSLQKEDINTEIKKITMLQKLQHSKQDIIDLLKVYVDGDINDSIYQKRLIDKFINCVYVFDDDFTIYFNLFEKIPKHSFEEVLQDLVKHGVLISNGTVHHIMQYKNSCYKLMFFREYFALFTKRLD